MVQKDTLWFSFDHLKESRLGVNEYVPATYGDRTHGLFFTTKKIHFDLKVINLVDFNDFVKRTSELDSPGRDKSVEGKLFDRMDRSVIIFVDYSSNPKKYIEMSVGLFSLD